MSCPSQEISRRTLLGAAAVTMASLAAGCAIPGTSVPAEIPDMSTPIRPPATPLIVRSPYLSTWLAADNLPGNWPTFWTGQVTALCGIARIDGTAYVFAGAPGLGLATMTQLSSHVTGTRSVFVLTGGGVNLTATFFAPVDPANLKRQCVPFGYLTIEAASVDGRAHTVDVHVDTSAEWVHANPATPVTWTQEQLGGVTMLSCAPAQPTVLREHGEQASWGALVLAAPSESVTWQIGQDTTVRAASAAAGRLDNTSDSAQPRPINDRWPVLALNKSLGTIPAGGATVAFTLSIGHVRTPAVRYLGAELRPWWTRYWASWQAMVVWFSQDYPAALADAATRDQKLHDDAFAAAGGGSTGKHYAAICALALRQAFAGTELVDRGGAPWAFLKEISSNGSMSTVDVIYPAFPGYLYLSPEYLRLLLDPVFDYAEHGGWPKPFAEHDLGHYPDAHGYNNGHDAEMPVEESANMLIMVAALAQRMPVADATRFVQMHYPILRKWAEYLVANALDPHLQNQTDDFTGFIAHSANLALKGIIGIGAAAILADRLGNGADAQRYRSISSGYISQWATLAQDGQHLKLAYDRPGTWSLKYNGFADRLLGLHLVPPGIAAQEAAWYQAQAGTYGVLLDPRNNYTKADWELWTAAWLADHPTIRATLIEGVYNFANTTPQRVPFTDWYVVADGTQRGFQARPVAGGYLALLTGSPVTGLRRP